MKGAMKTLKKRLSEMADDESTTVQAADNCIYINGVISSDTVAPAIGFIAGCNASMEFDRIVLFINSGGGDLNEGFALASVIRASNIPVIVVAIGECDSSALIIAMSADLRLVAPTTSILSHQYSAGIGLSKHTDLKSRMKDLNLTAQKVINHYVECTGLSESDVKKKLVHDSDVFLTPSEAVGFGLFDDIFYDFGQVFFEIESEPKEEVLVEQAEETKEVVDTPESV